MAWYSGDLATATLYFTDATGTPADPTTATLTVLYPDGTTATPALTHPATGTYTGTVTLSQAGTTTLEGKGTGALIAREIHRVSVLTGIT